VSLENEVQKLINKPTADVRSEITKKIADYYTQNVFTEQERKIAEDVIRLLAHDSEVRIRKILSNNLKKNNHIPHDVAFTLASDMEEVALPMLEFSKVLTQQDLINISKGTEQLTKLIAVARRDDITEPLSDVLIGKENETVARTLVSNKSSKVSAEGINQILNKFAESGVIMEALVERGGLSVSVIERIMAAVSSEIKEKLIKEYKLDNQVADELVNESYEQSIIQKISVSDSEAQITTLVDHLNKEGKLTHSLILRALCKGSIRFFEAAIAALTPPLTIHDIHNIICYESTQSFASIYKRSGMPKRNFEAISIVLKLALQETQNGTVLNKNFANRMIERIIVSGYDQNVPLMHVLMIMIKN
jgi:uncharacterized protein (DUF2336 family)